MKVSLVVLAAGKAAGQTVPITLSQFIIGRDPQCNLRPASAVISKRHCAILVKAGNVVVRDFDSTNGTFVNDQPVKGECPLKHDDVLKVGPLAFRVLIETTTPVNKPTPTPPPKTASGPADDESVAAMLLSLQDDSSAGMTGEDVPSGSTVMDVVSPTANVDARAKKEEEKKGEAKKDEKDSKRSAEAAKSSADTRAAAAAILEKYTRRQRT
jgi:pSer/pThr/pTyr-binding forkhead associated (FHA) protein